MIFDPENIYGHLSRENSRELAVDMVANDTAKFEPLYQPMDKLVQKYEMDQPLIQQDYETFRKIIREILKNSTWNVEILKQWEKELDEKSQHFLEHDMQNITTSFWGALSLMRPDLEKVANLSGKEMLDALLSDRASRVVDIAVKKWPQIVLIMEDISIRSREAQNKELPAPRPLNLDILRAALESMQSDSYLKTKLKTIFFTKGLINADEEVLTRPGVVGNFIFNVTRNAAKEKVDANKIDIFAERKGDELVFGIKDNGIGMSAEQLDPKSEKFIFNEGEGSSGTGGTGLGLADAPARLNKYAGAKVACASRLREQTAVARFPLDSEIDLSPTASTMFEIRLPITKKQK